MFSWSVRKFDFYDNRAYLYLLSLGLRGHGGMNMIIGNNNYLSRDNLSRKVSIDVYASDNLHGLPARVPLAYWPR